MSTPDGDLAGLLDLVQCLSPAFPTGAFAYSHGLEQAVLAGQLRDADGVQGWLADILAYGTGWNDAVLIGMALRGDDLTHLCDLARALAGSAERLRETDEQGRAFTLTRNAMTGRTDPAVPLPLAVARAARDWPGVHGAQVIALYLHSFAANIVSAAVRFVPLGQAAGQSCLAALHPLITDLATRAVSAGQDDLATSVFYADLQAMIHETAEVRIFKT